MYTYNAKGSEFIQYSRAQFAVYISYLGIVVTFNTSNKVDFCGHVSYSFPTGK
jgi:hypothetical protein